VAGLVAAHLAARFISLKPSKRKEACPRRARAAHGRVRHLTRAVHDLPRSCTHGLRWRHLITTECCPGKVETARCNLADAGLSDLVEVRVGDALQTLSATGPVNLLFLDGRNDLYAQVLTLMEPHLSRGALIVADLSADDPDLAPADRLSSPSIQACRKTRGEQEPYLDSLSEAMPDDTATASWMSVPSELRARLSLRPLRRRVRDLLLRASDIDDLATVREDLARRYLQGQGIEIGALHRPLRVPATAHVRYVDVMSRDDLLATYSSAVRGNPKWVVETDVIDDGARLDAFTDGCLDFVVANHMLEHTEDPIAALGNLVRVLRPGGILFLTLPDARHSFDALRARTTVDHLLRDHREGSQVSRRAHYREWAVVECLSEDEIPDRVEQFERERTRHHFHVWELEGFLELLTALSLPARLVHAEAHLDEFAVILRRDPS
jgi:predicted SAM-dependent methyltransferase